MVILTGGNPTLPTRLSAVHPRSVEAPLRYTQAKACRPACPQPAHSRRRALLKLSLDIDADDRVIGGIMLGRDRRDLGLNAFPRAILEQVGVGIGGHAGYFISIAAARAFVGG